MTSWKILLPRVAALWLLAAPPVVAQNLIILDGDSSGDDLTFAAPLVSEDSALDGRSIAELADAAPLFAPIEGLPAEVWEDRTCAGCHKWDQATLCTQAQFYLSDAGQAGLKKKHPYGGAFKQTLRSWGVQGCK